MNDKLKEAETLLDEDIYSFANNLRATKHRRPKFTIERDKRLLLILRNYRNQMKKYDEVMPIVGNYKGIIDKMIKKIDKIEKKLTL